MHYAQKHNYANIHWVKTVLFDSGCQEDNAERSWQLKHLGILSTDEQRKLENGTYVSCISSGARCILLGKYTTVVVTALLVPSSQVLHTVRIRVYCIEDLGTLDKWNKGVMFVCRAFFTT